MSYQTESDEGPKCPNCLCRFESAARGGDQYDTECPHCGCKVRVSVETTVTYYCGRLED